MTIIIGVCIMLAAGGLRRVGASIEPLRISNNHRCLVGQSNQPVFLLADTAWELAQRLNRDDVELYLKHRRAQQFTAVAFVLGGLDCNAQRTNAYGAQPFRVVNGRFDPLQPVTTPDTPAKPTYDYWDHVDYIVDAAAELGLYTIMLPAWGNAFVGDYYSKNTNDIIFNESNARAYGYWLGRRYRDRANIIWMLGGDRAPRYEHRDFRPVFRALAFGLAEGGNGKLISFHPQKTRPNSSTWLHADTWLSFNSIQAWPEAQINSVTNDWALIPAKPTWLFEGRYEGYYRSGYQPAQWGEWQVRQQAYQTVFAGAFGHTYGHERVFGFGNDGWDWRKELDAPGARCLTHLAKLINSLGSSNLVARIPDQALLAGEVGAAERLRSDRLTAMRTTNNKLALIYAANGRNIQVQMSRLAKDTCAAFWFNPRSGLWHAGADDETPLSQPFLRGLKTGGNAPVQEFDPPGEPGDGNDWVLMLVYEPPAK